MEKAKKKISIAPPEGEALARYTVRVKPLDVFKRQIYLQVVPTLLKCAVKLGVWWVILELIKWGLLQLSALGGEIDERLEFPVPGWIFVVLFLIYLALLLPRVIIPAVKARTEAKSVAAVTSPEEYAFFEDGMIFSNGKDLIRIPWKKVRLMTATPLGMVIRAGSETDTLIIPVRYFCTEYPELKEVLKKALGIRFIRLKKLGRDRAPMYENPREKVTIFAPEGEVIGELNVSLKLGDTADLNNMWMRQIEQKHNRGIFGMVLILICSAMMFVAAFLLKEPALLPVGAILLAVMIFYAVHLSIGGLFRGRRLLVNRRDYKKQVRYVFYPAGFLMIYENGISHVMYEDLDLIFEDMEGLGFFFSQKQCLFIPNRYMRSVDGVRLSHFFKASLFNLDPRRAHRKYRIEDRVLPWQSWQKKQEDKTEENPTAEKPTNDQGFGF